MSRADNVIGRNSQQDIHQASVESDKNKPYQVQNDMYHHQKEDCQTPEQKASMLKAGHFYNHRIAELQRQTADVQKLPDFYNERVANLKQRTMEIKSLAKNYTSQEKDQQRYGLVSGSGQDGRKVVGFHDASDQVIMYQKQ